MKVHLRNQGNFDSEVVEYYKKHAQIVSENEADIIVINDFKEANYPDKIVACNSTGLDHIKAKKIISLRGEDLSDITAVAELSLGMMIMITRLFKGKEIKGKILGIIGYGRIGKQFREMTENMGMIVIWYDKKDSNHILKDLLEKSDIVSLHITADEKNRNWFNKSKFKRMKDGSIFLNSSRPWLVDEDALKWALNNKLSACWYDFNISIQHKKLITTNHQGGSTKESRSKTEKIIAEKVVSYN